MAATPDRFIGKTLGYNKYHLKERLGGGSFGTVYRAIRRASQQDIKETPEDVAVKILMPQASPLDEGFAMALAVEVFNFSQEAQRITALAPHKHTVPLLELSFDPMEALFYFVMPIAKDGSLRRHIRKGVPLPPSTLLPFIEKAAAGLHHAHERKIVHRDVKPDNLLLPGQNGLWVSDFGIAVEAHGINSLPPVKQKGGTIPYMAPEQFDGRPTILSDVYGLAVVTYEGLTGSRPFEGNALQIEYGHRNVPPPLFSEKGIFVDDRLRALQAEVGKALAKDPEQRPASTTLFAQTLKDIAQEKPHGKPFPGVAVPQKKADGQQPQEIAAPVRDASLNPEEERMRRVEERRRQQAEEAELARKMEEERLHSAKEVTHLRETEEQVRKIKEQSSPPKANRALSDWRISLLLILTDFIIPGIALRFVLSPSLAFTTYCLTPLVFVMVIVGVNAVTDGDMLAILSILVPVFGASVWGFIGWSISPSVLPFIHNLLLSHLLGAAGVILITVLLNVVYFFILPSKLVVSHND